MVLKNGNKVAGMIELKTVNGFVRGFETKSKHTLRLTAKTNGCRFVNDELRIK